jgi:transcriptional regulator with XRE-family HTH domain|tara:strand:- start:581 stop:874 length:294 start_codon:yes stop_codon:yes gene_type:complete
MIAEKTRVLKRRKDIIWNSKIEQRRKMLGMTQFDLCREVNRLKINGVSQGQMLSQNRLSEMERGLRDPMVSTIIRIAYALKCDVNEICDYPRYRLGG